jgi:histidinol-phosphate aminotransferase
VSLEFNSRLRDIPAYPAAETYEFGGELVKLASNETPFPPHPQVQEAVEAQLRTLNRYPDPDKSRLRTRIAERTGLASGRVAVGNGSCELLLAAGEAMLEPGAELVYAWPSFSMYPYLAPLSGAREIRVPLSDDVHDLEAMLGEVTSATQLLLICNPNNPTSTHLPAARIAELMQEVPSHVTVIVDEAYVEFQLDDDPDTTVDLRREFANLVLLRTFSKVYGLAGVRVGYALCSPGFRAAVDAVRQPFSVNAVAQAAAAEAIRHQDDVVKRVERTIVERVFVEEGLRELGLAGPGSHTNFSWVDLGDADEADVVAALAEHDVIVRPGEPLGGPGHIRPSYGTRAENQRLLDGLAGALGNGR